MSALGSPLGALARATQSGGDATGALCGAVAAIEKIAERVAEDGALDGLRRRRLALRAAPILSAIIRRGVESGAFRPPCARWAAESLPHAIVAGVCARWVFGLRPEQSLGAGAAAAAALQALRPRVLAGSESGVASSRAERYLDHAGSK
jgi:hypothetical protein